MGFLDFLNSLGDLWVAVWPAVWERARTADEEAAERDVRRFMSGLAAFGRAVGARRIGRHGVRLRGAVLVARLRPTTTPRTTVSILEAPTFAGWKLLIASRRPNDAQDLAELIRRFTEKDADS